MKAFFHPDQHRHDPRQFMRLGVISDPKDLPVRTELLLAALQRHGAAPDLPPDCGTEPILAVHEEAYLAFLGSAHARWRALPGAGPEVLPNLSPYWSGRPDRDGRPPCRAASVVGQAGYYLGDLAVPIGEHTATSALASARTAVAAADAVNTGERLAYALCRPSGHHARADRASGFCYLNNAAIAAERLRRRFGRVAVLDVDTHHGDGTQEIFYRRADVLTLSLHGDPTNYYPFHTGYADETGSGEGRGCNRNIPLPPGTQDAAFLAALDELAGTVGAFGAEALVLALGYDGHREDPLATLALSTAVFRAIGARIHAMALPTAVVQEGGYGLGVIGDCLAEFLAGADPAG